MASNIHFWCCSSGSTGGDKQKAWKAYSTCEIMFDDKILLWYPM